MFDRFIKQRVEEALGDTQVVLVTGPRRAGKTTLVQDIESDRRTYLTLDDQATLDAARGDPVGFVRQLELATIDEIQRVSELLLTIKKSVDDARRPGRFLLAGSANILTMPRVADSLAGRMETIQMLPLAQAEITGTAPSFLERLFEGKLQDIGSRHVGDDILRMAICGGFPEMLNRESERRRMAWAQSYLTSVLTRDLRDIADMEKLTELPRFVRLLAEHSGQLANFSRIAAGINVSHKTAQRYVALLEQVFLVTVVRPWHSNVLKRLVKTPKIHFLDSGLLAAVRGLGFERVTGNRNLSGALLESFVYSEIRKLMTASEMWLTPFHFRDHMNREVDIVLERNDGLVAGMEVKASATVRSSDFGGLRVLAETCGSRFAFGVVLHDGTDVIPFGERLAAVPLSALWD